MHHAATRNVVIIMHARVLYIHVATLDANKKYVTLHEKIKHIIGWTSI